VDWRSIFAGAIGASAIAALLLAFGSALGLSMTSARAYAGFTTTTLAIFAAVWFCLVNVLAFAAGGYIAGRMRVPLTGPGPMSTLATSSSATSVDVERSFRDGAHGFLVWALGTMLAAYVIAGAGSSGLSKAVDAGAGIAKASVSAAVASFDGDQAALIADKLLRPKTVAPPATGVRPDRAKEEVARIVTHAVLNDGLSQVDRSYLVKVIAADTGLSEQEADARIEETVAAAKKAREAVEEKARDAAEMARKSAILAAMMAAAVSLLGLVAAVWASTAAGHDRDHRRHLVIFGQPIW
jgi:hypothetical protein